MRTGCFPPIYHHCATTWAVYVWPLYPMWRQTHSIDCINTSLNVSQAQADTLLDYEMLPLCATTTVSLKTVSSVNTPSKLWFFLYRSTINFYCSMFFMYYQANAFRQTSAILAQRTVPSVFPLSEAVKTWRVHMTLWRQKTHCDLNKYF